MQKIIVSICIGLTIMFASISLYAADFTGPCPAGQEAGTNGCISASTPGSDTNNILSISGDKLKTGDVTLQSIPEAIVAVITTLLGIAGTVAIFSLIYHAVQMQINSGITGDSAGVDKAKKGMIGALIGFVIAISAWFLVTQAVKLLGDIT